MTRAARPRVWLATLAVIAAWLALVAAVDEGFTRDRIGPPALSLAISFALVQIGTVAVLVVGLFWRKWVTAGRAARTLAIRGEIAQALAADVAGRDSLRALKTLARSSRSDVSSEIAAMAATLRGSARDHLFRLARELGIAEADAPDRIERLFARAAAGSPIERAIAAEELEPDAPRVMAVQIPRALQSSDVSRVIAALDFIIAWRKAFSVREVEHLLSHPNPAVRSRAVRALPYAGVSDSAAAIRRALRDREEAVQFAAAETARKLRLEAVMEALLENVAAAGRHAALAAAVAVAAMPGGPARLQALLESGGENADLALEAIEKAALGRLEVA